MLVLNRKRGERILIGESIVVTFVRMSGDQARIGIEAPDGILIDREEIRERRLRDAAKAIDAGKTLETEVETR